MKKILALVLVLLLAFTMFACGKEEVEETTFTYPEKTVEFIVPYAAGGGNDVMCRAVVAELPFTTVVTNMAGASSSIGTMEALHRDGDGYTVLVHLPESMTCYSYTGTFTEAADTLMTPIACPVSDPMVMVIGNTKQTAAKFTDLESLLAYKGEVKWCATGLRSQNHMISALAWTTLGLDCTYTPYDSGANSRTALLGGNEDIFVTQISEVAAYVKSGDMIPIMVFDYNRSSILPDTPTAKELGYGDLISVSHRGFVAPPDTSEEILDYLTAELKKVCTTDEFKQKMVDLGYDPVWVETDEIRGFQEDILSLCEKAADLVK